MDAYDRIDQMLLKRRMSHNELADKIGMNINDLEKLWEQRFLLSSDNFWRISLALGVEPEDIQPELAPVFRELNWRDLAQECIDKYGNGAPCDYSFEQYQNAAARTQGDLCGESLLQHALHGISAEVGEIHSIYQKSFQGHRIYIAKLIEEIGDLLWFISELCDALDIAMKDVAKKNIDKLMKRYPDGFDSERSVNRDE